MMERQRGYYTLASCQEEKHEDQQQEVSLNLHLEIESKEGEGEKVIPPMAPTDVADEVIAIPLLPKA